MSQHAFTIQCAWRRLVTRRRRHVRESTIKIQSGKEEMTLLLVNESYSDYTTLEYMDIFTLIYFNVSSCFVIINRGSTTSYCGLYRIKSYLCTASCLFFLAVRGWLLRRSLKQKVRSAVILQRAFRRYRAEKLSRPTSATSSDETETFVSFNDKTVNGAGNDEFFTPAACRTLSADQTPVQTPLRKLAEDFCMTPKNFSRQPRFESTPKVENSDCDDDEAAEADNDSYLVAMEKTDDGTMYNIYKRPSKKAPGAKSAKDVYKNVSAALMAAYLNQRRFQLAGAFNGIPYLEAQNGILSRRRMPRVSVLYVKSK